jgi:GNAT superfamily N-acetyltransferase
MEPLDAHYMFREPAGILNKSEKIANHLLSHGTELEIRSWDGFMIAASSGTVFGYYDVRPQPRVMSLIYLEDLNRRFMRPGFLYVYPENRGNGIGTILLEERMKTAEGKKKALLVQQLKPGEGMPSDSRDAFFPYSSTELGQYYKRRGFRDFTSDEAEYLTGQLNRHDSRMSRAIDDYLDTDWPKPEFASSFKEQALKAAHYIPLVCALPWIERAVRKRTMPWMEWWESKQKKKLTSGVNHDYVMSHLVYNPHDLDITKFNGVIDGA